jgi:hypothetical protein
MTNDDGRKPEGWRRRPFGRRRECPQALFCSAQDGDCRATVARRAVGEYGLAADLRAALSISTGAFSLHSVDKERSPRIRVRCHVAVPFGSTDEDDRQGGR